MSEMAGHCLGLGKRELNDSDGEILVEATLANLNWSEPRFTQQEVLSRSELAHYGALDLARGDFGVVVTEDDWLGVVWVLFLPPDDPGDGFVGPGIGEVSVSVKEPVRGRGLGRELMVDAIWIARTRGHDRLSLSVEENNPSKHLYRDLGCYPVVMIAHTGDETFYIYDVRLNNDFLLQKGFQTVLWEFPGGHYEPDTGSSGTHYSLRTYGLPYLNQGWRVR